MAYPSSSDFNSATPYSAWWTVAAAAPADARACASTGRSFVKRLQRRLNAAFARARREPNLGIGQAWFAGDVALTDALDAGTLRGLEQYARVLDLRAPEQGWAAVRDAMQAAREASRVTADVVRFGIWVAYLDGTDNPLASVALPAETRLPLFGAAPPDDGNRDPELAATCWLPGRGDPAPAARGLAALAPPGSAARAALYVALAAAAAGGAYLAYRHLERGRRSSSLARRRRGSR